MVRIDKTAVEGSTLVLTCTFFDSEGTQVTPTSNIIWKMFNKNWRKLSEGVTPPAEEVKVLIKGDDLFSDDSTRDHDVIKCELTTTYTSSLGANLPLRKVLDIPIDNVRGT